MEQNITADELARRFNMLPHEEGGSFLRLEALNDEERNPSGSIYYYLPQSEASDFHQIDCDEYWAYVTGDTLELWLIDTDGNLAVQRLGIAPNAQPLIKIPTGCIFAARHTCECTDGTFLSCITVPQFNYEGWQLFSRAAVAQRCPAAAAFWE